MDLPDLLEPERIRCNCDVKSKKRTLQTLAELLGESLRAKQLAAHPNADDSGGTVPDISTGVGKTDEIAAQKSIKKKGMAEKVRNAAKKPDVEQPPDTLTDMEILDALIGRERLGSTGLGHGVALPHARLGNISEPIAAFVTLETGVDFESADGQVVDLAVGLLVPENCNDEHLKILAKLARRFSDEELRAKLRTFDQAEPLYAHLLALPSASD